MFAGVPLEDDVVDVVLMQKLAKEKAGRAGADDRDLRSHVSPFVLVSTAHGHRRRADTCRK